MGNAKPSFVIVFFRKNKNKKCWSFGVCKFRVKHAKGLSKLQGNLVLNIE